MIMRKHKFYFPKPRDLVAAGKGFATLAQSEALDDGLIRIKAPAGPACDGYFDSKLLHSMQLQAICDNSVKFLIL